VAIALRPQGAIRAVIFDLDEALLQRAPAWCYSVEQAVLSVSGKRIDAALLAEEYRARPWAHVLPVVLEDASFLSRCTDLCETIFYRSAMKRLLVHEGLGMALDALRGGRIEIGAITREPHANAIKQVQSTGLDRFLAVLAATPPGEPWHPGARIAQCLGFLDRTPDECVFVSHEGRDLAVAARVGCSCFLAGWASRESGDYPALAEPSGLAVFLG
jgi:phosphoglycolate phosphatase-like HAD superfamily hydrolase